MSPASLGWLEASRLQPAKTGWIHDACSQSRLAGDITPPGSSQSRLAAGIKIQHREHV